MKKIIIIIIFIIIFSLAGYFGYIKIFKKTGSEAVISPVSTEENLSIPEEILGNKFGFLSYSPEDAETINSYGAAWTRPHPGPFLWDAMQKDGDSQISFKKTDEVVKGYQEKNIGILVTLWPFADWDQKNRENWSKCKVSSQDEFLQKEGFVEGEGYLPEYRCNPDNWQLYENWIKAVVERYDGDGKDDMPGLKIPVKYWEVMNEPDLSGGPQLMFYMQQPRDYAELLVKTHSFIKEADNNANVLIAGAAGGSENFLSFYKIVFEDKRAKKSFDIGNVHCISNDNYDSFNVEPYKKMFKEFGIEKPIWITEAETMISTDYDINATQTLNSTKRALSLGVERIFFTRYDFKMRDGEKMPPDVKEVKIKLRGADAEEAYKKITSQ